MSQDGKSRPLDANANGYVYLLALRHMISLYVADRIAKGEGGVVVVLKPLDAALADKDHIYSVVSQFSGSSSR